MSLIRVEIPGPDAVFSRFSKNVNWYCIHTRGSHEAVASFHLREQGRLVYLPQWRDHNRLRPLFPSYLFMCGPTNSVRGTRGVIGIVSQGEDPIPVPEKLIEGLWRNERSGLFDVRLKTGQKVRLKAGPFQDLIAEIVSIDPADRIIVLLNFIQPLRLEVEYCDLMVES